jgi:peptide/nickel transport system substrate-binding protein
VSHWSSLSHTRPSRRRVLAGAALSAGAGTLAAACGRHQASGSKSSATAGSGGSGTPRLGGTLHAVAQQAEVATLDPQAAVSREASTYALSTVLRFKAGPDPQVSFNHELENDLAVSAESPDAQTWTVKLRTDARFHDIPPVNGHPVEADDVKATFVRAVTLPGSVLKSLLDMVDPGQIETPATDTLVFKLKYHYGPFAHALASPNTGEVLPREALAGDYDPAKTVIGSGPFTWESYTPDVAIMLKKYPAYYEKGLPYVDTVQVAFIPDAAQQLAQFTAGNLDLLAISEKDIDAARKSNPRANVIQAINNSQGMLYFQLGDPSSPFQDVRLRRAISMAIDRGALCKAGYDNHCGPASFSVYPYMGNWALSMNDLDAAVRRYYTYNLAAAKQLFDQAGGSSLSVRLAYFTGGGGSSPETVAIAQAIYNMLQQFSWQISLVHIDYSRDFVGGGKGWRYGSLPKDTILSDGMSTYSDPDQFLYGYYDSKSTASIGRVNDPKLDAMIAHARTIADEETRRKAYLDVQKLIADQMYEVAGLPSSYTYQLNQPWLRNVDYVGLDGKYVDAWRKAWLAK